MAVSRIDPEQAAREIIDTMADALVVCDPGGRILLANHALERVLGYRPDEIVGKSIDLFVVDPDSTFLHNDRLQRVLERGPVREQERTFFSASGEKVEVSLSASSLIRGDEHAGVVIAIRDIGGRKRAEEKIRRSASLLGSTLESTADGILVTDLFGSAVIFNEQLSRVMQVDLRSHQAELEGTGRIVDYLLAHLQEQDRFWDLLRSLLERPDAENFDVFELHDGRVVEVRSIPQRMDQETIGRVWSFRDVTESRQAEAALRASETRYRQLFERNLAGVYRSAPDGRILDANEAFARILGWEDQHQLIGRNWSEILFDPSEREELMKMLGDARKISGLEFCLRKRDGTPVWVIENMTLIDEGEGEAAVVEGTLVDISGLKIAEEQMEFQAYHDVLTTLPNRKLFTDRLTVALAQARRTSSELAVIFLDLDNFKNVNDSMGHAAGDELLVSVAERLTSSLREGDTIARIGGDEFTILAPGLTESEDAIRVSEQVLESLEQPFMLGDRQVFVTASLGVALAPGDGNDSETLLKNADSALYRAKESGGNNYQLCTEELKTLSEERAALEHSIRLALERDEFELYYQPVINIVTGKISAVEALLRWQHPELGLTPPERFISLLEASRLVFPVGEWVLRTACRQAMKWIESGMEEFYISVNLSPRQFRQRDLATMIADVLTDSGLPAKHLQIEITETTAMDDVDVTVETLRALRAMGVAISIDDFGVGYSSLSYLKRLPIDAVKIDRSFVRDLERDESDVAIVQAVLGLGRILDLRVIAEGVETERQLEMLRSHGCREMQGFLFSRPIPAAGITLAFSDRSRASLVPRAM